MTEKTKEYLAIKNFIHNELKLDFEKIIRDEIAKYLTTSDDVRKAMVKEMQRHFDHSFVNSIGFHLAERISLGLKEEKENETNS